MFCRCVQNKCVLVSPVKQHNQDRVTYPAEHICWCKLVACEHIFKKSTKQEVKCISVLSSKNACTNLVKKQNKMLISHLGCALIFDGGTWALFNASCLIWSPQGRALLFLCFVLFSRALLVREPRWFVWPPWAVLWHIQYNEGGGGGGSCCWRWLWS